MPQDRPNYGLSPQVDSTPIPAPDLNYLPPRPRRYRPRIGLIGAGGITEYHLRACRTLGLEVAVICDLDLARARARRDEFYPEAEVCPDFHQVLARDDVEVIDAAVHPEHRLPIIEAAIGAGKHLLSQKPFVLDLDRGERIVAAAADRGVCLAVNQNGRWAPHFAYLREAVRTGLIGELGSVDFQLAFDHGWTVGTPFEEVPHLLLYDFGVHWFDLAACLLGEREVTSVFAAVARTDYQQARPPFLASALLSSPGVQVRLTLNGAVIYDQSDVTLITGSRGTLRSHGPNLSQQQVTLTTAAGRASPELHGTWFDNGFQGAMGELLCAIEDGREPLHSARNNLRTLAVVYAALHSANTGRPVRPGTVRAVP
jgi:predicted dehydrogenase